MTRLTVTLGRASGRHRPPHGGQRRPRPPTGAAAARRFRRGCSHATANVRTRRACAARRSASAASNANRTRQGRPSSVSRRAPPSRRRHASLPAFRLGTVQQARQMVPLAPARIAAHDGKACRQGRRGTQGLCTPRAVNAPAARPKRKHSRARQRRGLAGWAAATDIVHPLPSRRQRPLWDGLLEDGRQPGPSPGQLHAGEVAPSPRHTAERNQPVRQSSRPRRRGASRRRVHRRVRAKKLSRNNLQPSRH